MIKSAQDNPLGLRILEDSTNITNSDNLEMKKCQSLTWQKTDRLKNMPPMKKQSKHEVTGTLLSAPGLI